jgi:hypothetical protein
MPTRNCFRSTRSLRRAQPLAHCFFHSRLLAACRSEHTSSTEGAVSGSTAPAGCLSPEWLPVICACLRSAPPPTHCPHYTTPVPSVTDLPESLLELIVSRLKALTAGRSARWPRSRLGQSCRPAVPPVLQSPVRIRGAHRGRSLRRASASCAAEGQSAESGGHLWWPEVPDASVRCGLRTCRARPWRCAAHCSTSRRTQLHADSVSTGPRQHMSLSARPLFPPSHLRHQTRQCST